MANIFEELSESGFWKNEEALSTEYLPPLLPHRENEIRLLARNLLPLAKKKQAQNTFVFGPPGIGKTATVKFVFRDLEEYAGSSAKAIYINCWDYRTSSAILTKLVLELGFFIQRRGVSKDEIKERLVEALRKNSKALAVCLDEVDQLIKKDANILYDLLRLNDYVNIPIGLVFISNDKFVFRELDPRIKSSLNVMEIEFKPYTLAEMKDILEERVNLAFKPGCVEDGVVLLTANHAIKNGGDVRVGLKVLRLAASFAEQDGSSKIKVEHVKKAIAQVGKVKPEILQQRLTGDKKLIIEIIKQFGEITSGQLYEEFVKKSGRDVSERGFRNYLNELIEQGILEFEWRKGQKGRTRLIRLRE
ncbi:MAG: AAA family ATPase [Candidatus Aenigmarchaeota archaeon]|nr:AAA family ATPase [Candidatus Aenigmarchaeota archaeon]